MAGRVRAAVLFLGLVIVAACGEDGVQVDAAVAPFVGTWVADSLTLTSDADTTVVANLLDFGSFSITVEPSGQYTATLTVFGQANPEIGQLGVVNASTLTLTPSFPPGRPVATATYAFQTDDFLILDGPSEFDFNLDLVPEPAQAHFELQRQ